MGKEEIVIPVPAGYLKADGEKQVSDFIKRFAASPNSNVHLLTLLTPAAVQAAHAFKWNGRLSFYVQTSPASLGDIHVGTDGFEKLKNEMRNLSAAELKSAVDKATKNVTGEDVKELLTKVSTGVGKPIQLEEGERFLTCLIPFDTQTKVTHSVVLCKGKILFLYAAENPTDPIVDINHMRDWVQAIIAANPMESPAHAEAKQRAMIFIGALVGMGVMAGLALLIYLWWRNAHADDELYKPYERSSDKI